MLCKKKKKAGTKPQPPAEDAHHCLGKVLNKFRQCGIFQDFEHGVFHFLFIIHVIALMATELVLCYYLKLHKHLVIETT